MRREAKIGVFLAVAFVILATFIFIVGDMSALFKKSGYSLSVTFDSAAGLEKRAAVKMAGVQVGYIKEIQLVNRRAQITMSIYSGAEIPKDSRATFWTLGLLGEKYIEIIPGRAEVMCQAGETIEGLPSVSFDQMGTLLLAVSQQVKEAGKTLKDMMGEETQANFKDILKNLSAITANLNEFLGVNSEDAGRVVRRASESFQNLDQKIKEISENISQSILMLQDTVSENRENVRINIEKIKELITEIEKSVKLLNESLEKINKGQGTLGKIINDPELYRKTESTLEEVRRTVSPISSLQAFAGFRSDYYGKSGLFKTSLSLDLWLTSQKYFLAQVIRDPWQDRFTFSAQVGRRWGGFVPRAGLIESEFGVGVDYLAAKDRLMLSLESFDFNRQTQPHFRLSSRYSPLNYLYVVLGVDDFTLSSRREIFFGLGLGLQ